MVLVRAVLLGCVTIRVPQLLEFVLDEGVPLVERHALLEHFLVQRARADVEAVISVVVSLIVYHFEGKHGHHEVVLVGVALDEDI